MDEKRIVQIIAKNDAICKGGTLFVLIKLKLKVNKIMDECYD
jgi:hypothetical protein